MRVERLSNESCITTALRLRWRSTLLVYTYVVLVPKITQYSYCTLLCRARGARAYNGGLHGGRAPSGVQGQTPWSEGQGAKPIWSWKPFKILDVQQKWENMRPFYLFQCFTNCLLSLSFAQFYKIVLHTFKFLLHTLCSKTHYFRPCVVQVGRRCIMNETTLRQRR